MEIKEKKDNKIKLKNLLLKAFKNKEIKQLVPLFKQLLNSNNKNAYFAEKIVRLCKKNPFSMIKNRLKLVLLKKILRKKFRIVKCFSNSIVFLFKKWKATTNDKVNEYADKITNLLRKNANKKQVLKSTKKKNFLNNKMKILGKHFKELNKKFFDRWKLFSKLIFFHEKAIIIQSLARAICSKELLARLKNNKKFHYLYKKNQIRTLIDAGIFYENFLYRLSIINGDFHKKLIVNSIIAKFIKKENSDKLMNLILSRDGSNLKFNLSYKFKIWKFILKKFNNSLNLIQKFARVLLSKNKLLNLIKRKGNLKSITMNLIKGSQKNRNHILSIMIKKWLYKCILSNVIEKAIVIQKSFKSKVARDTANKLKTRESLCRLLKAYTFKYGIASKLKKIKLLYEFVYFIRRAFIKEILKKLTRKNALIKKFKYFVLKQEKKNGNLEKYLNLWRDNNINLIGKENSAAIKITQALKSHQSKTRKQCLLKRKDKTSDLIIKLYHKQINKNKYYLNKWMQIIMFERMNDYAAIIQSFLKSKTRDINSKQNSKFILFAKKLPIKQVLIDLKKSRQIYNHLRKLCPFLANKIFERFLDNLRNSIDNSNSIKKLVIKINRVINRIKEEVIRKLKLKSALVMRAKMAILHHYKKHKKVNIKRDKVNQVFLSLYRKEEMKLKVYLLRWINIINFIKLSQSALIIQKYVRKVLNFIRKQKYSKIRLLINKVGRNKKILVELKEFRKNYSKVILVGRVMKYIRKCFLQKLIKNKNNNYIKEGICILEEKAAIVLKNYFKTLLEFGNHRAAKLIQRYIRQGMHQRKNEKIHIMINDLFVKKYIEVNTLTKYYLNIWQKNVAKIRIIKGAFIITRASKKYLNNILFNKKVLRFIRAYFIKRVINQAQLLRNIPKKGERVPTAFEKLEKTIKKITFNKIKKNGIFFFNLRDLIENSERNNKLFLKRKVLKSWKKIKDNYLYKNILKDLLMNLYLKNFKKNDIKKFSNLSKLKQKLTKPLDQLKNFINLRFFLKFKGYSKMIYASKSLKKILEKVDFEIIDRTSNIFLSFLFKTYCFKLMERINLLTYRKEKILLEESFKIFKKHHINIITITSLQSYTRVIKRTFIVKPLKLSSVYPNYQIKRCDTYNILSAQIITNYFNSKIKERKQFTLNKIATTSKQQKALSKLLSLDTKKIHKSGSGFLEVFKNQHTKVKQTDKVRALIRKYVLRELNDIAKITMRIVKLVYLIKVTYFNNKIAQRIFMKNLVHVWHFHCVLKNTAKRKMQSLYKNVNQLYQTMAEEMFGNKPDSLKNNYAKLSENLGTFTNDKGDGILVKEAMKTNKVEQQTKRKYIFKNNYTAVPFIKEKSKEKTKHKKILRMELSPYRKNNEEYYSDKKKQENSFIKEEVKSLTESFENSIVNIKDVIEDNIDNKKVNMDNNEWFD